LPEGGSDPQNTFWAARSRKSGVAPAQFDFFRRPLSLLLRLYLFADQWISIRRGEERAPKKVQLVISTFFTLRADPRAHKSDSGILPSMTCGPSRRATRSCNVDLDVTTIGSADCISFVFQDKPPRKLGAEPAVNQTQARTAGVQECLLCERHGITVKTGMTVSLVNLNRRFHS